MIVTPIDAWYVRSVPISSLVIVQARRYTSSPWFRALVESIKTDGLMSPILVDNRKDKMRVAVGMNRVTVMRELEWTHCPCLVYGRLPLGVHNAVPTRSLEEIQSYINDGEVYQHHDGGLCLRGHHPPEKMKYPIHKEPFHGSSKRRSK